MQIKEEYLFKLDLKIRTHHNEKNPKENKKAN